jgi:hypothetical protein
MRNAVVPPSDSRTDIVKIPLEKRENCYFYLLFLTIIISLLMSSLLGHRPSLWITGEWTRTQCGLVGANDCKRGRDQRLYVPSEARRSSR